MDTSQIKVIAFDADDTLWDCQGHFEQVMQQLYDELLPWVDRETAARELFATERKNMLLLGFGTKAFTLSMLETAMRVSRYEMSAAKLSEIQQLCYTLNEFSCDPLPEVKETLEAIPPHFTQICFTKGELLDQEHKLERSRLKDFFSHIEITSNKGEQEFRNLCNKLHIKPHEMLMVGNSLKSDIAPALAIGCMAVYIPFHVTWELEHTDQFEHPHMVQIDHFGQLLDIIGNKEQKQQ